MNRIRRKQWRVIYKNLLKATELIDEDGASSMIISGKYSRYEAFRKIKEELRGYGVDDPLYYKLDSQFKLKVAMLRRPIPDEDWDTDTDYYAELINKVTIPLY